MRVYLVKFYAYNFETYEDHREWEGVVKAFDSEEKAINFINNESCIKPVLREALCCQVSLEPDQPIQFVKIRDGYNVWWTSEIFSEDGNSVIGYKDEISLTELADILNTIAKEIDSNEVPYWHTIHVYFSVEGLDVE